VPHYIAVGEVPRKRHTQFRQPDGSLYCEELMGEEGFSSDSSLLYHRTVPSAITASRAWELPDLTTTPNHPLRPAAPEAARAGAGAVGGRRDRAAAGPRQR
jgi:homogentisate 1,2-dioxygenase